MRALALSVGLVMCAWSTSAQDQTNEPPSADNPISAIDWLSDSLSHPVSPAYGNAPVTTGIITEPITIQSLDDPSPDGVGLLSRAVTGLPANLWGASDLDTLTRLIASFPAEPLPAVQDQFRRVMLAELDPPLDSTPDAPLLQARVDALLARGAVVEAEALLERAASNEPELFRRAFDVGLLTGREQAACARMRAVPGISPSFPVRIFCLARTGDWAAAALTLESAKALGQLSPEDDALLAQFLDADLSELLPPTAVPTRPSPLTFRMLEAIGSPIPTAPLPVAFAHSDLRPTAGWKARVEAAERLARAGAVPPNVLVAVYGERAPAASGGAWDRVAAVQKLTKALDSEDEAAIANALPTAWTAMKSAGLALPFAEAFAERLLATEAGSGKLAIRLGLLSDAYETVALDISSTDPELAFLTAIARGEAATPTADPLGRALAVAFADPAPTLPPELSALATEGRFGEALLTALDALAGGAESDPSDITGALTFLRAIGLEDTARRSAIQMMLLDRSA